MIKEGKRCIIPTYTQYDIVPCLSYSFFVPSPSGLNGAPPPHSWYISGVHIVPSRSNAINFGSFTELDPADADAVEVVLAVLIAVTISLLLMMVSRVAAVLRTIPQLIDRINGLQYF